MIKKIITDTFFLSIKSKEATKADLNIVTDLVDTMNANENKAIGLAANMIGYSKRIIIVKNLFGNLIMLNPKIISKKDEYIAEEGCLSLPGVSSVKRYRIIKVKYQDVGMKWHEEIYTDLIAQAIQHEIDHLEGILV